MIKVNICAGHIAIIKLTMPSTGSTGGNIFGAFDLRIQGQWLVDVGITAGALFASAGTVNCDKEDWKRKLVKMP